MDLYAVLLVFTRLVCVENKYVPRSYLPQLSPIQNEGATPRSPSFNYEISSDAILAEEAYDDGKLYSIKNKGEDGDPFPYSYDYNKDIYFQKHKEPCAIVVLSNVQNPKQSLLRKYKYDANGALIPSSVKYFMKIPQKGEPAPILVPLNDKSISHLGGYLRYYKEVPPIPQSW